jgi:DNA invertase Pin-like site-specific DNA recombinase
MKAKENTKNKTAEAVEAYGYCRVSGKDQESGDGFERQGLAISNFADFAGFRIVRMFHDIVTGASDWENREQFNEMVHLMRENGVKTVIIERQDRLARKLTIQESIIEQFEREGFAIWSTEERKLTNNSHTDKFKRQIMGAVAELDKNALVEKLRVARSRMREQQGRCEGRKAYGSTAAEQDVILRMKEFRRVGMNFDQIAATFNSEGVATRTAGRCWYSTTVSRILKANDGRRTRKKFVAAEQDSNAAPQAVQPMAKFLPPINTRPLDVPCPSCPAEAGKNCYATDRPITRD